MSMQFLTSCMDMNNILLSRQLSYLGVGMVCGPNVIARAHYQKLTVVPQTEKRTIDLLEILRKNLVRTISLDIFIQEVRLSGL